MSHHELRHHQLLNFVANQPEVLSAIAPGYLGIDLSGFLLDERNILIGDEHGLVLFAHVGDGLYDGHYLLTDTLRGAPALRFIRAAIREVFTTHGASVITGATPRGMKTARAVNRALGFHPVGECTDTMGRSCIKYILERTSWEALLAE